ncbi:BA75_04326T0 [Komagataella pastoris]|uniref:BA75_04326T0 n=1 Tax=Komagataella pastoris TaxID=4922 RepID=A0A1B2JES7_PICPA|nr:BA75_04326T0 [Komagataella pastoris]
MSVPFGVDLGNNNTVIGVARNRGIDILVNEVSNRQTPSIVGFGAKSRAIGESGKTQQNSNLKNTVEHLVRILGLPADSPDYEIEKKYFTSPLIEKDNEILSEVNFQGKKTTFTPIQLVAMYLNKIKNTAIKETKGKFTDICLAVPVWFTEKQRSAASDACKVAGLNPVRIVNDITAAAVGYGVFKTDLPEDEAKKVAIVDIGHSTYSVLIAAFKKGELKVLGSASDKHFGGRDFDYAITKHFAEEFKSKYKIDITQNAKAWSRVYTAAERLKKVLSANTTAPFNVESVMNDVDVSSSLTREELETLVQPLLDRAHTPVERALAMAGLKAEDVDTVEVVGGCTRVPALKATLSEVFGKPLSFTLNQDEAIARGAAFICAMHSPTLRVRPFKFEDVNPYSVSYYWDKDPAAEDDDHLEVFPVGGSFPSTKVITLYRSQDFNIEARYTDKNALPAGTQEFIGRWSIKGVVVNEGEDTIQTKIKLRNDPSGFHIVESAYTVEKKTIQEPIEDPEADEDAEPQYKTVEKLVKKNDLEINGQTLHLPDELLNSYLETEAALEVQDKLVADTEERKNALEEYIYELRGKLEDQYKEFASEQEKTKLSAMLEKAEEWLYDEGYDSTKAKYIAKYEELASIGNVIRGRYLAKEEEKKQAIREKEESKKASAIAEKMAAERASREAAGSTNEQAQKDEENTKDADGDVSMNQDELD